MFFAYDNTNMLLYKSTNSGVTWTSTNVGTGIEATLVVEDGEDVWDEVDEGDVAETLDADAGDVQVGAGSVSLALGAGVIADDILASEAIAATDLSGYDTLKLWIRSTVTTTAGQLDIEIDEDANLASPEVLNVPALVANTWTHVTLPFVGATADRDAIISVGITDDDDIGVATIHLDDIKAASFDVVGIAISPEYATDSTLVIATADTVYRSANAGVSFGEVSSALLVTESQVGVDNVSITSIDLAMYYTGGQLAILIGTRDNDADESGGVFLGRLDTWTWVDQEVGNTNYPASGGGNDQVAADVFAVAFSPNHTLDAQILAVVTGTTGAGDYTADTTYLATRFAANTWGADVLDATIGTAISEDDADTAGHAVIAFADDYEWSSMNRVLVGTTSDNATLDDVYRVHGGLPGGASLVYDLNVSGTGTENDIYSIGVSGSIAGATVVLGLQDSNSVKRTSDPTTSTVTWSSSIKSPIGDAADPDTTVILAPDFATSNTVYVATDGTNSGLSVSTDGAITFNGLSLIEVSDTAVLRYVDSAIIDANTMFLIVHDDVENDGDFDALAAGNGKADTQHLFKTTDGGATWQRVWFNLSTGTEGPSIIGVSPEYTSDQTLYVAQNDTRIWKTTDGGGRFIGLAAPTTITALTVIDGGNYFTGHDNGRIYHNGYWNYGATDAADDVVSIALSPDFATDDTVFAGTDDGDVFYSTNASATVSVLYTQLGADQELGVADDIIVVPDPGYTSNSTIYAGSADGNEGVNRWVLGTSISWFQLDDDGNALVTSGLVLSPDGSLYAASNTANDGVRRSVAPTAATVALADFESMITTLPAGAQMENLGYIPGSNVLYAIISGATATTTYPAGWLLLTITDTFSITPTLIGPEEGAETGTSVGLSWEAITAPAGTLVTYEVEVALDAAFANLAPLDDDTTGTAFTVTGLTAGTQYWWRIYVDSNPLTTRRASSTFQVILGAIAQDATLSAPAPGSHDVSIRPNFQWSVVAGATGYRLELSDSASFADGTKVLLDATNIWSLTADLEYSTTYYWRVKAINASTESAWSNGVFTTMAAPAPPATVAPPDVTVQAPPAPKVTVQAPPAPQVTVEAPPAAAATKITPAWIYAIIIVGAVLVIAVIVLIVRTRRVV